MTSPKTAIPAIGCSSTRSMRSDSRVGLEVFRADLAAHLVDPGEARDRVVRGRQRDGLRPAPRLLEDPEQRVHADAAVADDAEHGDAEQLRQARGLDLSAARAHLVDHGQHERRRPAALQELAHQAEAAAQGGRVDDRDDAVELRLTREPAREHLLDDLLVGRLADDAVRAGQVEHAHVALRVARACPRAARRSLPGSCRPRALEPVSALKSVVLPAFGEPISATRTGRSTSSSAALTTHFTRERKDAQALDLLRAQTQPVAADLELDRVAERRAPHDRAARCPGRSPGRRGAPGSRSPAGGSAMRAARPTGSASKGIAPPSPAALWIASPRIDRLAF